VFVANLNRRHAVFCRLAQVGVLLTLGLARSSAAQELTVPSPRQGYYLSGGGHAVLLRSRDEDLGRLADDYGSVVELRVGQMVTPWLGLGIAVGGGQAASSRWSQGFGGLLLDVQLAVWRNLTLHGSAGLGAVVARDTKKRVSGSKGTAGAYYGAGLRYDFFPFYDSGSGGLAVTPCAEVRHIPGQSFNATMFWVGVDLAYWGGLDKQELALPPDQALVPDS
jgi:hypothetical protein